MTTTGRLRQYYHKKEQVLVSVRERSLQVRAMRIFQLEKHFTGGPQSNLYFTLTQSPSKKNRLSVDIIQHSPPHPALLKHLLHQKVLFNFHTAPKYGKKPTRYVTLHFRDRRGSASLQQRNRATTIIAQLLISETIWSRVSVLHK